MQNEKLKNIDNFMKASDIIEFLEENKNRAESSYNSYVRSDGIPKKGKAMFANAASCNVGAVKIVINWLESELERRQNGWVKSIKGRY